MPWKDSGSLEEAKNVAKDWHLGHGVTEPHPHDQSPSGPQVSAAILEVLDARGAGAEGTVLAQRWNVRFWQF